MQRVIFSEEFRFNYKCTEKIKLKLIVHIWQQPKQNDSMNRLLLITKEC